MLMAKLLMNKLSFSHDCLMNKLSILQEKNMFRLFRLIYHQVYNVRAPRYLSWFITPMSLWFMVRK
jgi:hypothetical protein